MASPSQPTDPPAEATAPADLPCADFPLATRIESLLMSSDRAMTEARLAEILGLTDAMTTKEATKLVGDAIEELNETYRKSKRAVTATRLAGGWQILTRSAFGPLLSRLHADRQFSRLSQAALETLAIVSYRQPIIRAEIEAIRGVACGEVLRGLLERRLVKIVGRAEELGRPMLYGTTKEFLTVFGLANLEDLPAVEGLENDPTRAARRRTKTAAAEVEVKVKVKGSDADAHADTHDAHDPETPRDATPEPDAVTHEST